MSVLRDVLVAFSAVVVRVLPRSSTRCIWCSRSSRGCRSTAEVRRAPYSGSTRCSGRRSRPGISVLVPAFNEEAVIVESVRRCSPSATRATRWSSSTTARTTPRRGAGRRLRPRAGEAVRCATVPTAPVRATYVSRRAPEPAGASTRRTAAGPTRSTPGINAARHPYVCVIDADSLLEEDALLKVAKPILDDPESRRRDGRHDPDRQRLPDRPRTGRRRSALPTSRLATIQVLEYLRAFLVARVGWSRLQRARHHLGRLRSLRPARRSKPSADTGRTRSARTSS